MSGLARISLFLFPVSLLMWYSNSSAIAQEKVESKQFPVTPFLANNSQLANRSNSETRRRYRKKQSTTEESTTDSNNTENPKVRTVDLPTLKIGMRGSDVFWVQKRLQAIGFFQGSVDGIFGKDTQAAVIAAQEKYGLKPDGIVGVATWQAILP